MKKVLLSIVALVIVSAIAGAALALAPEGSPTRAIQNLDKRLDDYKTGSNLSEEDEQFNKDLKQDILHGTFDVMELSRLALSQHWFPRTYGQRTGFVDLMQSLLENKAILSKEQGRKKAKTNRVYTVQYATEKFLNKAKTRAIVRTIVYVKSEDISVKLEYKLRKKGSTWHIYDVILDGASLVDNYKYQFDRIIVKDGYPELIFRMDKKLGEIKNEKDDEDIKS